MDNNDLKKAQRFALLACLLSILFWAFFNTSKHNPLFAEINPFANDPFDAVGSFGMLLAPLVADLALLGCLRPHPKGWTSLDMQVCLNRVAISLLAVTVTMLADSIALVRSILTWSRFSAGWLLSAMVLTLLVITIIVIRKLAALLNTYNLAKPWHLTLPHVFIFIISALALFLFPDQWRSLLPGALLAVLVGMTILFMDIRIIGETWLNWLPQEEFEDVLDDLQAIYQWKKKRFPFAAGLFTWLEKLVAWRPLKSIIHWFSPRQQACRLLLLLGFGVGVALLIVEMQAEGLPALRLLSLVSLVYTGFMIAGIMLGDRMLNHFIGIIRKETHSG